MQQGRGRKTTLFFIRPLSHTRHPLPVNTSRTATCVSSLLVHFSPSDAPDSLSSILSAEQPSPSLASQHKQNNYLSFLPLSLTSLSRQMHQTFYHPFYRRFRPSPSLASQHKQNSYLPFLSLSLTPLWSDARDSLSSIYRRNRLSHLPTTDRLPPPPRGNCFRCTVQYRWRGSELWPDTSAFIITIIIMVSLLLIVLYSTPHTHMCEVEYFRFRSGMTPHPPLFRNKVKSLYSTV